MVVIMALLRSVDGSSRWHSMICHCKSKMTAVAPVFAFGVDIVLVAAHRVSVAAGGRRVLFSSEEGQDTV